MCIRNSIKDVNLFFDKIQNINPTYSDISEKNEVILTWHIPQKAISALLFEGNGTVIWNYYDRKTENKDYGTMDIKDFKNSIVHKFIMDNF